MHLVPENPARLLTPQVCVGERRDLGDLEPQFASHALRLSQRLVQVTRLRLLSLSLCSLLLMLPNTASALSQQSTAPGFRSDILPLLQRQGCSQLSCHGAFKGQGGFRLSLYGREPDRDAAELLQNGRVDPDQPEDSLLLQKAMGEDDHGGGERIVKGSWQYTLLRTWIQNGAPDDASSEVIGMTVRPARLFLADSQPEADLTVLLQTEDGRTRDVTHLALYTAADPTVCRVSETGHVVAAERIGIGQIVVQFLTHSETINVYRSALSNPDSESRPGAETARNASHALDSLLIGRLRDLGREMMPACTDEEFLRRVSLDLCGVTPSIESTRAWLQTSAPRDRQQLVDHLLQTQQFTDYWSGWLARLTGCEEATLRETSGTWIGISAEDQARLWQHWIRIRVADDIPVHAIIRGLVQARGRNEGQSWRDYLQQMEAFRSPSPLTDPVIERFAALDTNPLFWAPHRFNGGPADIVADRFLGIQMSCAKCHDHPHDVYTQRDYQHFNAVFQGVTWQHPVQERRTYLKYLVVVVVCGIVGLSIAAVFALWRGCFRLLMLVTIVLGGLFSGAVFVLASYVHLLRPELKPGSPGVWILEVLEGRGWPFSVGVGISVAVAAAFVILIARSMLRLRQIPVRSVGFTFAASTLLVFVVLSECDAWYIASQPTDGRHRNSLANGMRMQAFAAAGLPASEAVELKYSPSDALEVAPRLPDGTVLDIRDGRDPRDAFMDQLIDDPQSQLAQAFVNHVWTRLLGNGLVEPGNGFSTLRRPVHEDLLLLLTEEFIREKWSLRRLVRSITLSRCYQQSQSQSQSAASPELLLGFTPRGMNELQLVRSIDHLAGSDPESALLPVASEHTERGYDCTTQCGLGRLRSSAQGRILRVADSDDHQMTMELALLLMGNEDLSAWLRHESGRIHTWAREAIPIEERIEQIYLLAYCRLPEESESRLLVDYVRDRSSTQSEQDIWVDVLWAVVNSREFLVVR